MKKYNFDSQLCQIRVIGNYVVDTRDYYQEHGMNEEWIEDFEDILYYLDKLHDKLDVINSEIKEIKS